MSQPPLFGLLPAGQPLITVPTATPSPTSLLYAVPQSTPTSPKPFAHLAVFLLPGAALPDGAAAAIYVALNPGALGTTAGGGGDPDFRFLGGIGPGKESAVFKLSGAAATTATMATTGTSTAGNGIGATATPAADGVVVIGINIEDASSVAERIAQNQNQTQNQGQQSQPENRGAMTKYGGGAGQQQQPSTQVLAQRIIQNAFNFLSGFSGQVGADGSGNAIEVVPLKAFQEWWKKFESKVRHDPSFLERDQD